MNLFPSIETNWELNSFLLLLPELLSTKGFPGALFGMDLAFEFVYKSIYLSIWENENFVNEILISDIWGL